MKKIVFVNPPLTLKERFGDFAEGGNIMPSLGICYLAAVTREKHVTKIIDASVFFSPFKISHGKYNFLPRHNPYYYHIMVKADRSELISEICDRLHASFKTTPSALIFLKK